MSLSARRNRTLRGIVLCCAALLFAAQTLAVAHVHAEDSACVVCPHAHATVAVDAAAIVLPEPLPGRSVQRPVCDRSNRSTVAAGFHARAPPASVR